MDSATAIFHYFPNLSPEQKFKFEKLSSIFIDWNNKINLISRKDTGCFYERHVLHSLGIAKILSFSNGSSILDIGTGGGFPGIPLAILFPEVQFTMVDSIHKKIKVVNDLIQQLELKNAIGIASRGENITGSFDFVISRAVARLNRFIPLTNGKIKTLNQNSLPNGILYLKGGDLHEEIAEIAEKSRVFNLSNYFNEEFFETKKVVYIPIK